MNDADQDEILEAVKAGRSWWNEDACWRSSRQPFADIGLRQGGSAPKDPAGRGRGDLRRRENAGADRRALWKTMRPTGRTTILITRHVRRSCRRPGAPAHPLRYHADARVGIVGAMPRPPDGMGKIAGGHRRHQRHAGGGGGRADRRGPGQPRWCACMMWGWPGCTGSWPIWMSIMRRQCHHRHRRDGGRAGQRHRRTGGLPGHRRPHQRGLRRLLSAA